MTAIRPKARSAVDLCTQVFNMCGVDLTRIDGIDVTTALAVISETGAEMSRFPTAGHFASWLGLCAGTKITGGKVMSSKTRRCANRAAQALRLATAAAHKLARLIYTMLTKGEEYLDQGQACYDERYRERVVRQLTLRASKLGMRLVAAEQPA